MPSSGPTTAQLKDDLSAVSDRLAGLHEDLGRNQAETVRLTASLEAAGQHIVHLRDDLRASIAQQNVLITALAQVNQTVQIMRADAAVVSAIVRDGNGQQPLVARVSAVETSSKNHDTEIEQLKTHYNALATARVTTRGQLIGMVATALLATAGLVVAIFKG